MNKFELIIKKQDIFFKDLKKNYHYIFFFQIKIFDPVKFDQFSPILSSLLFGTKFFIKIKSTSSSNSSHHSNSSLKWIKYQRENWKVVKYLIQPFLEFP